jgi:hypothetical protein
MSNATVILDVPCTGTLSLDQLSGCCHGNRSASVFETSVNTTACLTNLTDSYTSCIEGLTSPNICICTFSDAKPYPSIGYTGQCGDNGNICNINVKYSNKTQPILTSGAEKVSVRKWITCIAFVLLLLPF